MSPSALDEVVLVDRHDMAIGSCEKLAAHATPGFRHRAFSVVLFDGEGRLLLQRRASGKYHFGGRWSNSCCGHPRPDEDIVAAGARRVSEELGLRVALDAVTSFEYRAEDPASGLVEHEIDHVLRGSASADGLRPNPAEVGACQWIDRVALERWMVTRPDDFTPWFASVMRHVDREWR